VRLDVLGLGAVAWGLVLVCGPVRVAAWEPRTETTRGVPARGYERAEAETIRTHLQEILADPRYAPHKTFGQWLMERLARWGAPRMPRGMREFFFWFLLIWCLLTLAAILAHLGWTIWLLLRPQRSSPAAKLSEDAAQYETASFEQLWERSAELARAGSFRAALGILLLALLRQLEARKVLRFHRSKTNGEYVREYPAQLTGRREFVQFVAAFERTIYGGSDVTGPTYDTMNTLARQVLSDASPKPQI